MHVIIHPTIKKNTEKTNIIHKKINLNDHFTVLAEMEIGLGHKFGTHKIGGSTVLVIINTFICEVDIIILGVPQLCNAFLSSPTPTTYN